MNPKSRVPVVVGAVVLVVALIAVLAAVLSSGDDSDAGSDSDPAAPTVEPTDVVGEVLPVEVDGDPLPTFEGEPDGAVGSAAPVVSGQGFDGTPMSVGGPTGSPTLVVFLAHWCPHCNREIPELVELNDRGDIPDDLEVVGVSTAVASDRPNYPPSQWLVEKDWPWPAMADDQIASTFGAFGGSGFPFLVLLDGDGTVVARTSGESSADEIQRWIDESLATASA
jgi:thiol-disulfide isomerase/thioredoxin